MAGPPDLGLLWCVFAAFLVLQQSLLAAADGQNTGSSSSAPTGRQRQQSPARSPTQRTFLEPMRDFIDFFGEMFGDDSYEDDRHSPYGGRYPPYPPPPYPPYGGYPPYSPHPPPPIYPPHIPYGPGYPHPPYPQTGYPPPLPPLPPPLPLLPHGVYRPPVSYGPPVGYPAPVPVPVQPVYPAPVPTYGTLPPYPPQVPTYNHVKPIPTYGTPAHVQPVAGSYGVQPVSAYGTPPSPPPVANYGPPAPPKPVVTYGSPVLPPKPAASYAPAVNHEPISGYQGPPEVKPIAGYNKPPPIASYGPTSAPYLGTKTKPDSTYFAPHDDPIFNKISQIPSAEFDEYDYDFVPPSKPSKSKGKEKWIWT